MLAGFIKRSSGAKMEKQFDDDFYLECGISQEKWELIESEQASSLRDIYYDYKNKTEDLSHFARNLSGFVQKISGVHSVRWRVKSPNHLIKKILRKKEALQDKYLDISVKNYMERVTDLVGVRILHLIKGEFTDIHSSIMSSWELDESPVAYVRSGDPDDIKEIYAGVGLRVEDHPDGYRSIHYIIKSSFTKNVMKCELQVRTIFEEGWSEIDHKLRYPDFSEEPLISSFLHIFNRISGAADEMGTFVHGLADGIEKLKIEKLQKEEEASKNYKLLLDKISELENIDQQKSDLQAEMGELRKLLDNARLHDLTSPRVGILAEGGYVNSVLPSSLGSRLSDLVTGNYVNSLDKYGISSDSFSRAAEASKRGLLDVPLSIDNGAIRLSRENSEDED